MEHESDGNTNCRWGSRYSHQRIDTGPGGFENKRTSGDYSNYGTVEIGQNTEKSPGDLRRLAVTQTPVEDHQLTLVWKTLTVTIIIQLSITAPIQRQKEKQELSNRENKNRKYIDTSETEEVAYEITLIWLRRGNVNRETESQFIAA